MPEDDRRGAVPQPLLTPQQVAKQLVVSADWIYRRKDEIGYIRVGGLVRFEQARVDAYIAESRTGEFRVPLTHVSLD